MRIPTQLLFAVLLSILVAGCSTEVDLNAPYKETTVVYGLLDPVADTQWVKINRTFLGDGNNLDYALIRDSSEYRMNQFTTIQVEELSSSGEVISSFPMDSLTIHDKSLNGIFYGPDQTVYYFSSPGGLHATSRYRLHLAFTDGRVVTGETDLVKPAMIQTSITQNSPATLILGGQSTNGILYKNAQIWWIPDDSAPFYELTYRFHYTERLWAEPEHNTLVSEEEKFIDYFVGSYGEEDINSAGKIFATISGESFFSFLGNRLVKDPLITRQIGFFDVNADPQPVTRCFDAILNMGGTELYTYYQVNTPVTGIIQDRPSYTNISNGIGLFSSRSNVTITDINLINSSGIKNPGNLYCLVNSPYTVELNFCDPDPSSDYPCE